MFFKVRGIYTLRSELKEDAVESVQVVTLKLSAQFPEQSRLLWIKALAVWIVTVEIKTIHHTYPTTMTAPNRFNRVGTNKLRNVMPDCLLADVELICQIAICIVPSTAQHLQQFLTAFCGAHAFTPFRVLLKDDDNRQRPRIYLCLENFLLRQVNFCCLSMMDLRKSENWKCSDFRRAGHGRNTPSRRYYVSEHGNAPRHSTKIYKKRRQEVCLTSWRFVG